MSSQTTNSVVKIEKVPKLCMCRICLVENVRMYVVADKSLQELYEKLTDVPFMTEDNRPECVCSFCYAKLKQCCQLQKKCLQSEQLFMLGDYELKPDVYQCQSQSLGKLITTPVENISIVEDGLTEKDAIKVELPDPSETQYEIELIQLKGEPPDFDADKEDSHQLQEDFPLRQIKSEPEDDAPLMVMKFEEEEEQVAVPSTSTSFAETPELGMKREQQEMIDPAYYENNGLPNWNIILTPDNPAAESDEVKEPNNPTVDKCIVEETGNNPEIMDHSVTATDTNGSISKESAINTCQSSDTKERPFKCDLCDKSFTKNYHLKSHIRTHTGEKPYDCSICQKSFAKTSHLKSHILIHTGEKPYKCQICEKAFKKTNHLNLHLSLHSGEKPFQCEVCQKTFTSRDYLNKHAKTHSGRKPYDCTICQKIFAHLDSLKKHLRMHTGEKPYKCDKCDLNFARKDNLNEHVRKHTGERPFKCHLCPKSFSRKETLRQHVCRHTGERAFKCYICQAGFIKKENLYKHLDRHISENHV